MDYLKDFCLTNSGKSPNVDLITVDSNLPIVNGITLVREINKLLDEYEEQLKKTTNQQSKPVVYKRPIIFMYTNGGKSMK